MIYTCYVSSKRKKDSSIFLLEDYIIIDRPFFWILISHNLRYISYSACLASNVASTEMPEHGELGQFFFFDTGS